LSPLFHLPWVLLRGEKKKKEKGGGAAPNSFYFSLFLSPSDSTEEDEKGRKGEGTKRCSTSSYKPGTGAKGGKSVNFFITKVGKRRPRSPYLISRLVKK